MKKLVLALSVIAFTACNNNQQKDKTTQESNQPVIEETVAPAETGNENVITISGGDDMKFDKTELKAKAGETVKLILKHIGKAPIEAMGHNVVILAQGTDFNTFANAAIDAKDNGYIPKGMENAVIAKTDMIGGGQTTEITFTAPAKGSYDFLCSFPGHYIYMKGKLIVEQHGDFKISKNHKSYREYHNSNTSFNTEICITIKNKFK